MDKIKYFFENEFNYIQQHSNDYLLYSLLGIFLFIFIFRKLESKFFIFTIVTLPATIFHELTHFIISLLTGGMPRGFSIIPKKNGDGSYTMGSVTSYNVTWWNGFLIGLAPLLLIPLSYFYFKYYIIEITDYKILSIHLFILASMLEGSIPSSVDLKLSLQKSYIVLWGVLIILGFIFLNN